MNETLAKSRLYKASHKETVKYAHLDLSFPTSNSKWDELSFKMDQINQKIWKPFDWFHNDAITIIDHMTLNTSVKRRIIEEQDIYFRGRHNLKYPKSYWNQYQNSYSRLQRWRELGDIWLVKSAESPKGYAMILITGIKEISRTRYIEFMLVTKESRFADEEDFVIESGVHSNISYDIILHPMLIGKLFENDKRLLHKVGNIKQDLVDKIRLEDFSDFISGSTANKYTKSHVLTKAFYDFETSLLSQDVNRWIQDQKRPPQIDLDIEFIKGLENLKEYHEFLTKKASSNLTFEEISKPYATHLWKLSSSFKDGLSLISDEELGELDLLVLVDKNTNKEKQIKLSYF